MRYYTADNGEQIPFLSTATVADIPYKEEAPKEYNYWQMQHALRIEPQDTYTQVKEYLVELDYKDSAVSRFMHTSRKEYAIKKPLESYADWICSPDAAYIPA